MVFAGQILAHIVIVPAILFGTCFGMDMILGGISVALQKSDA